MRFKCLCIAITILFLAQEGISQECPEVKDEKIAVQFLLDHKANSRAADRECVDEAFGILGIATGYRNKNYIKFLVGMLDFERGTPDYAVTSEQRYPAIDVLHHLDEMGKNVVPYLIRGIKRSDSEVLRANAAETLYRISACEALKRLSRLDEKAEVPYEQKLRLEAATKYIQYRMSLSPPCDANSSEP